MSQVGKRFREARESRGLSIAQASIDIRIQQQSLIDLEEGAYHRLPNSVVIKGFIRNYAQYLDLPADEIIQMYRAEQGSTSPVVIKPVTKVPRTRSYVLPSFFGVFFVTIALVGLAYVALNAVGMVGTPPIVNAPETATVATPTSLAASASNAIAGSTGQRVVLTPTPRIADEQASTSPSEATTEPSPQIAGAQATPIPINEPTPSPSPTQEAPIVVEVRALTDDPEGSWVRAVTDGTIAYEQVMLPGEQQVFLAQRQVQMRFGNPTAIQVSVNGLEPEIIGGVPGVPVDWSWPPR